MVPFNKGASRTEMNAFINQINAQDPDLDFTIRIQQFEWKVHSKILSRSCDIFRMICDGPYKESLERSVTLHDHQLLEVARMLQFLYCNKYTIDIYAKPLPNSPSLVQLMRYGDQSFVPTSLSHPPYRHQQVDELHASMYLLAKEYDIKGLAGAATNFMAEIVKDTHGPGFRKILALLGENALQHDSNLCRGLLMAFATAYTENPASSGGFEDIEDVIEDDLYASNIMLGYLMKAARTKHSERKGLDNLAERETTKILNDVRSVRESACGLVNASRPSQSPSVQRRWDSVVSKLDDIERAVSEFSRKRSRKLMTALGWYSVGRGRVSGRS